MSYSYVVEESGNYRVRLVQDEGAECPRDTDEFACGALTLPSRDYNDVPCPGELAETAGPRLFGDYGRFYGHSRDGHSYRDGVTVFERWVRVFHGGATLYDTPHEGPGVVWYLTPAMMSDRGFTEEEAADRDRMAEILQAERGEYRAWAGGDAWGYVIEKRVTWTTDDLEIDDSDRETWEQVADGSVWGFIGTEYAENEARAALVDYAETAPIA